MNALRTLTALTLIFVQLLGISYGLNDVDLWEPSSQAQELPDGAVLAGINPDGFYIYVGAVSSTYYFPANIVPELGRAQYFTGSTSTYSYVYSVLVANATVDYEWVRSFDGHYEKNAVSVGFNSSSSLVFICRAQADGGLILGSIVLSEGLCNIKYDDTHPYRQFDKYEILIRKFKTSRQLA